jgi:hypothetical protein
MATTTIVKRKNKSKTFLDMKKMKNKPVKNPSSKNSTKELKTRYGQGKVEKRNVSPSPAKPEKTLLVIKLLFLLKSTASEKQKGKEKRKP